MEERKLEAPGQTREAGESSSLGILEKTYGSDFGGYLGCAVLLFALLAIPLYLAGAFRSPQGWVSFGIIFVCLGGGVTMAFLHRKWQISVYAKGLKVTKSKQVQMARWEDIIAVDHLVRTISSSSRGYNTRSQITEYQLRLRNGPPIMITNDFTNRSELIERIEYKRQQARANDLAQESSKEQI
ncbi:MAG TPA: DUF6585 family protein [Ktedonobacteraceae bacterium]|nr:DUF6585 family protein [Ktedonobacteraceae bacterium]